MQLGPFLNRFVYAVVSAALLGQCVFASPTNSRLLALVPQGAQVIAGFNNHKAGNGEWRLLYITRNNRLDLDDWQALAGVDNERMIDEVVAVDGAPSGGWLTEHLLLLQGRFDKKRIFNSAERNGARTGTCEGETVLIIKPFSRESGVMLDTRWLAILDNRFGILGTELMVQEAVHRYVTQAKPDKQLLQRLAQIHSGVSSWNVVETQTDSKRKPILVQSENGLSHLLQDITLFTLGARLSHKFRLDFSLHTRGIRDRAFFAQKAQSFAEMFAAMAGLQPDVSRRSWLADVKFEPDHVHGSIELSAREFRSWSERSHHPRGSQ